MLLLIERLLLFAAWSAVAYAVAAYAAHATRRRGLYIPLFLILFLAPAWDVVPGLVAYNAADASVGGMHIYRPGVAEGYLEELDPPEDRRSRLLRMTPRLLDRMDRMVAALQAAVAGLDAED